MAFVHCHECGWQQDDFWSKPGDGYNPLRPDLVDFRRDLIEMAVKGEKFESGISLVREQNLPYEKKDGKILVDPLDLLAHAFHSLGRRMEKMEWVTEQDFKEAREAGEAQCPECGSEHLDID